MRRTYLLLLLTVVSIGVGAQPSDLFRPEHPAVMGRGGSFVATATGYNSFFHNPAGFARRGELTLASVNLWAFADRNLIDLAAAILSTAGDVASARAPTSRSLDAAVLGGLGDDFSELQGWIVTSDPATIETILRIAAGDAGIEFSDGDDITQVIAAAGSRDIIAFLEAFELAAESDPAFGYPSGVISRIVSVVESGLPSGYLRIGGQFGFGYVGNGIGLGLFANAEAMIDGPSALRTFGAAHNTISFVGGVGMTFGDVHVGVAVRPTILGYTIVRAAPALSSYLAGGDLALRAMFTDTVYYGSGIGFDVGALWELGQVGVAIAAKDIFGTRMSYRKTDFDTYYRSLLAASLPVGTELTSSEQADAWTVPPKLSLGVQLRPHLGALSQRIDPSVGLDLVDVTSLIRARQAGESISADHILSLVNVGGEVTLLRFLSLRGGYYGGYLAAGVGLNVFLFDLNAAVAGGFGRNDVGRWGFQSFGGSVELAIRF